MDSMFPKLHYKTLLPDRVKGLLKINKEAENCLDVSGDSERVGQDIGLRLGRRAVWRIQETEMLATTQESGVRE
ncbi:hypothetical protein ACHWQZ_G002863 [Mnemiopsis leidyi]